MADCNLDKALEDITNLLKDVPTSKGIVQYLSRNNINTSVVVKKVSKSKDTPEFDKLPSYDKDVRSMTYAGIGSRETPIEVQKAMYRVAKYLEGKGFTLYSGGANGADKAFEGNALVKGLYVALSRASEKLVVIGNNYTTPNGVNVSEIGKVSSTSRAVVDTTNSDIEKVGNSSLKSSHKAGIIAKNVKSSAVDDSLDC